MVDSIGFVVARVRARVPVIPSLLIVTVSARPSRRELAASDQRNSNWAASASRAVFASRQSGFAHAARSLRRMKDFSALGR